MIQRGGRIRRLDAGYLILDAGLDECGPGDIYAKIISRGKISELKIMNQRIVKDAG